MPIKKIKTFKDLPFEEGKTYTTKFQTGEKFILKRIVYDAKKEKILWFDGIYERHHYLGVCPIAFDRLIPEKVEDIEIDVCSCCGAKI